MNFFLTYYRNYLIYPSTKFLLNLFFLTKSYSLRLKHSNFLNLIVLNTRLKISFFKKNNGATFFYLSLVFSILCCIIIFFAQIAINL